MKEKLPDVEKHLGKALRSETKMTLGQLRKQMQELTKQLDRLTVSSRTAERHVDKRDEEDEEDGDDLFKAGKAEQSLLSEDDEAAAAERLRSLISGGGKKKKANADGTAAEDMMKASDEDDDFDDDEFDKSEDDEDVDDDFDKSDDDDVGIDEEEEFGRVRLGKAGPKNNYNVFGGSKKKKPKTDAEDMTDGGADEDMEKEDVDKGDECETTTTGSMQSKSPRRVRLRHPEAKDDETMKYAGREVRKSQVGEDLFAIFQAQQDRIDSLEKNQKTLQEQAEDAIERSELLEYGKVADENIANLPGNSEDKAVILRKLSKHLDPAERRLVSKMLRAGDRGIEAAFQTIGHGSGREASIAKRGGNGFEKRVAEIKSRAACGHQDAIRKARLEHPEEFKAYQEDVPN